MAYGYGRVATLFVGAAAVALLADTARAQSAAPRPPVLDRAATIEELVVTARKVTENLQDVPISMTAISAEKLDFGRISTQETLNNISPNVQVWKPVNTSNNYSVYIRGVGRNSNFFNAESPVAIYVDDVVFPYQVGPVVDVGGLERVEVLRGPQGTLYGRNATVGAVKYVTQKPSLTDELTSYGFTAGKFGRAEGQVSESIPVVSGVWAAKADFAVRNYDGYVHDLTTGGQVNGTHTMNGRFSTFWKPAPDLNIYASVDGTHAKDPIGINVPVVVVGTNVQPFFGSWYTTASSNALPHVNNLDTLGGTVQAVLDYHGVTLKSVTAYRTFLQDFVQNPQGRTDIPSTGLESKTHDGTFTQEFQATGGLMDSRLTYVAGVFLLDGVTQNRTSQPPLANRPVFTTRQAVKSYAGYIDGTVKILPQWSVSAGVRQTRDEKTAHQTETSTTVNYDAGSKKHSWQSTTYRFSTDYKITSDILAYASYGTGFKGGQLNTVQPTSLAAADVFIPPETVTNTEAGLKTEWLEHRLRVNVDYFWTNYKNMTQAILVPGGVTQLAVADAKIDGLELEFTARPLPDWSISGIVGTMNSRYVNAQPGNPVFGLADPTLQHAPKLSYHLWTDYTFDSLPIPGSLTVGADYAWTDKTYESINHSAVTTQSPYELLGFKVIYVPAEHHQIILQGTNVTNTVWFLLGSSNNARFIEPPSEFSITYKYTR
ncbi:MAG: TonB-dependent receptor [Phenylobacterium sp.]|jgi:iron complex outermembrane receptor protein|nr:TonB-dependent receptor [Phenylobacterium sp.]